VAETGQKIDNRQLDALCEYYLPRVFQYTRYWVDSIETAEDISLRVLKNAIAKIDSLGTKTESVSIKVFSLARESVNLRAGSKPNMLSGLTSEEREVVSLKLGAELTNRSISKILGLSESSISRIIYKSLCKLKGCTEDPK
jgi:DNA-directed RNA polymerase specialized sigma24 family protein